MNREVHVRFCEHLKGKFLWVTRPPVAQLDPGSGKTQHAYLWAYRSNDFEPGPRIIVFDYQTSRSGKHARDFLDGWQGHLVVDDYAGYKSLFTLACNCTELGCWAHARRKFFDLHQASASTVAFEALQRIGKLYAVEDEGKHLTIETRQILRTEKACRSCNRCTTGCCKPAFIPPMAAEPPKPSTTP